MEHRRFKNQYNYVHDERSEENANPESQTVPDQSLSIQDILYRFTVGLPLDNVARYDNYDEEDTGRVNDSDDSFDVHPANGGATDILDYVEGQQYIEDVERRLHEAQHATTTNDDANKASIDDPTDSKS